jgi:hypothetical protein
VRERIRWPETSAALVRRLMDIPHWGYSTFTASEPCKRLGRVPPRQDGDVEERWLMGRSTTDAGKHNGDAAAMVEDEDLRVESIR